MTAASSGCAQCRCRLLLKQLPRSIAPTATARRASCLLECPAGNNWALGYHTHGGRCAAAALNAARREAERCDHLGGFLLLQSLAGGTGAGFGSRLAQELADWLPSSLRLSCAVWPYESGEVIVQAYNTLLSVGSLLETCDALLLLRNEELHATCAVRFRLQPVCVCACACLPLWQHRAHCRVPLRLLSKSNQPQCPWYFSLAWLTRNIFLLACQLAGCAGGA
jgi:Tubulin/FtsZ family, GTPase domain